MQIKLADVSLACHDLLNPDPFGCSPQEETEIARLSKLRDDYESNARYLTDGEIDALVVAVQCGKNSFAELQKIQPRLNSPTMYYYLADVPAKPLVPPSIATLGALPIPQWKDVPFCFVSVPADFSEIYEFKPEDAFTLSVDGRNRCERIKEKQENRYMQIAVLTLSAISALLALLALAK